MHPRLLHSLALIEPVAFSWGAPPQRFPIIQLALQQRDLWPTADAGALALAKSPVYRSWDPRCLALHTRHALRPTPTPLYPSAPSSASALDASGAGGGGAVTLTTTRHQDAFSLHRANFDGVGTLTGPSPPSALQRLTHVDAGATDPAFNAPFYRPEVKAAFDMLPALRPACLFVHGAKSPHAAPAVRAEKMRVTGTAVGGSGGVAAGRVSERVCEGAGHFLPLEKVDWTADEVGGWLIREAERWRGEERVLRVSVEGKSLRERSTAGGRWEEVVRTYKPPKPPMEELKAKM